MGCIVSSGLKLMVSWEIIKEELSKPSIFKGKESLAPEFLPDKLPHREEQLRELVASFKHLVISPGSFSQKVLIVGSVGTGKTATARIFGRDFTRLARQQHINLKYVHVNCHRNRVLYNVILEIARQLEVPLPQRGLSAQEMYTAILSHLDEMNAYAIIALDEFDYFASIAGSDAVYFLVRTYDEYADMIKRLNFIFITRSTASLSLLDSATESYLLKHIIKFNPYTSKELYDILVYRADQAFYEGVVDDDVLKYIAEVEGVDRGGRGNARFALELLMLAGEAAEKEGVMRVTVEHVRKAFSAVSPEVVMVSEAIYYLPLHELLILWATVRLLERGSEPYVKIGDVEKEYAMLCEMIGEEPRRHTQVYEYVMNLKRASIVDAKVSGKGYRGRTTLLSIRYGPLDALERLVEDLIRKRKIEASKP